MNVNELQSKKPFLCGFVTPLDGYGISTVLNNMPNVIKSVFTVRNVEIVMRKSNTHSSFNETGATLRVTVYASNKAAASTGLDQSDSWSRDMQLKRCNVSCPATPPWGQVGKGSGVYVMQL